MKKILLLAFIVCGLTASIQAASVTLTWNLNPEPDIVSYSVIQSNNASGVTVTNTVSSPTKVTTFDNVVAGTSYTFWATAKNSVALESDKSAPVSYLLPTGVPPIVVLNPTTVEDFRAGNWINVRLSWPSSPTQFVTTNYAVTLRNVAVPSNTSTFNTTATSYTFVSVPHDDWVITVAAQNQIGPSQVTAASTFNLSKAKPNAPVNLRVQ